MALPNYPDSKTIRGNFNTAQWLSLLDASGVLKPDHYERTVKRTGMGERIFDWLEAAKMYRGVKARTLTVFEEGDLERTVRNNVEIDIGAAGADITLVVHTSDRDANGQVPLAVDDGVVIPGAYQATGEDRIYVVTAYVAGTWTATLTPLSADGTTVTESEVSVAIPVGTRLKVHGMYKAVGTGQPAGSTFDWYSRTYKTQFAKTSMFYEGGVQAIQWYPVVTKDGKTSAWIVGQENAERIHSRRIDDGLFLGELNDNALLVETSQAAGSNKRLAAKGIWNWALDAGQQFTYAGTWSVDDNADLKDYLRANNVTSQEVVCWTGTDLYRYMEDASLDFIREYSGGTDLMLAGKIGIDIKYIHRNGIVMAIKSVASFANPNRYGGDAYNWTKKGLAYPVDSTTVEYNGATTTMANLQIGYLNNNGEDRRRIMRVLDGMTGRERQAVNAYDMSSMYILSEFMPIVIAPNKLIYIEPE